jgi:hypothetical protein
MALHEHLDQASAGRNLNLDQRPRCRLCHGCIQSIHLRDSSALVQGDAYGRTKLRLDRLPSKLAECAHDFGHACSGYSS